VLSAGICASFIRCLAAAALKLALEVYSLTFITKTIEGRFVLKLIDHKVRRLKGMRDKTA
jgi:hypothetical protein